MADQTIQFFKNKDAYGKKEFNPEGLIESNPQFVYDTSRIVNKFIVEWSTLFVGMEGVSGLVSICPAIQQ